MVYTFPLPRRLNGEALESELAAVGIDALVCVVGDSLEVAAEAPKRDVDPVVAAHTGEPTPDRQAELDAEAETETRRQQLDTLRDKARAVWAGDDTFTQAQAQRILAGLVLLELRRR